MSDHHEMTIEHGSGKKSFRAYVIGLLLCIALTLAAFGLVEYHLLSPVNLYIALAVLAVTQLWVQSLCFLRLNSSPDGQWNLRPLLFTIFIIAILVGGTLWIMYNLNYYMYH
jgi:cytochrome o ubiquinol oxidase subunit IV